MLRLRGSENLDYVQLIKKPGGSLRDSYLAEGFVLDKKIGIGQPRRVENAKVMVANTAMDSDKIKIYGARVKVASLAKVAEIEVAEKEKMAAKCIRICDHGINVFINRQLIYNYPEEIFAKHGVMAIEHADFEGVERLAARASVSNGNHPKCILQAVLGAEICSTFDHAKNQWLDGITDSPIDGTNLLEPTVEASRLKTAAVGPVPCLENRLVLDSGPRRPVGGRDSCVIWCG